MLRNRVINWNFRWKKLPCVLCLKKLYPHRNKPAKRQLNCISTSEINKNNITCLKSFYLKTMTNFYLVDFYQSSSSSSSYARTYPATSMASLMTNDDDVFAHHVRYVQFPWQQKTVLFIYLFISISLLILRQEINN